MRWACLSADTNFKDLAPSTPRKEFGKRCFSYNGAIHWNNLPYQAKIAESLSSFKSILKQE
jgi:hypothetical protein